MEPHAVVYAFKLKKLKSKSIGTELESLYCPKIYAINGKQVAEALSARENIYV
jgi:hypothetical protein